MALLSTDKIWERDRGMDEISERTFNGIFSLTTVYGMFLYGVLAAMCAHTKFSAFDLIVLIVACIGSAFLACASTPFNLVGLSVMAGTLGAVSGPFLAQYKVASIESIAFVTVFITLVLGFVGWTYPKSLENWWSMLFIALLGLIAAQILLPLIFFAFGLPLHGLTKFLDWVGVVIFSGYIIFDFNRAQQVPKTVDNAISCGVAVFLDVVNLFIRLLELFGVKTSDD